MEFVIFKHLSIVGLWSWVISWWNVLSISLELGSSCCYTKTINWADYRYSKAWVWKKSRKVNWTKEEEYTLIEASRPAGDALRGTGQSADINKKKMRLWNDVMKNITPSMETTGCERGKKKWNNLKGFAKARGDCSRRKARMTGGGPNEGWCTRQQLWYSLRHGCRYFFIRP